MSEPADKKPAEAAKAEGEGNTGGGGNNRGGGDRPRRQQREKTCYNCGQVSGRSLSSSVEKLFVWWNISA